MKLIKVIIPILAIIGVVISIMYMGKYNDLWSLIFCWFCLEILFWWYLANVVFTTSKKDRRNMAYRKVVKRKNDDRR